MSDLPKGWAGAPLGDLCTPRSGRVKAEPDDDRPYLGLDDIESETTRILGWKRAGDYRSASAEIEPGDIVYARLRPYLNKVCLSDRLALGSAELIVMEPTAAVVPRYLLLCLSSPDFVRFADLVSDGDRPRVKWKQIAEYEIPLPPLAEQKRIVAAIEEHFSHLDAAEASLDRALSAARALERSAALVIRAEADESVRSEVLATREARWLEAVEQKLAAHPAASKGSLEAPTPPSADLPVLPAGWQWSTLDEVTHFVVDYRGKTPPRAESGVPVVSAANVRDGVVEIDDTRLVSEATYLDWVRRGLPDRGDLAITTEAPVAAVGLWPGGGPYLPTRRVMVLKTGLPDNRFLMHALRHPEAQAHIRRHMRGTTVPRILKPQLMATPIPLPSASTITRLVGEVEAVASRVESARSAIEHASSTSAILRRSVLASAFNGELVPQDPSDEPASALLDRIREQREGVKAARRKRAVKTS